MRDQAKFRERFMTFDWTRQFGNLASTLTRLGSQASDKQFDEVVTDLLREGALMLEWSAPQAPEEMIVDLGLMQRELVLWRRIWPSDNVRPLLTHRAYTMADTLLTAAGYYEPAEPST
jgi:hypothetical protein